MDTKEIAQVATDLMDGYPNKSTEWCAQMAADECDCDRMDVFDALIAHPEISGFA